MKKSNSNKLKITFINEENKKIVYVSENSFLRKVCHQRSDRSFFIQGKKIPLCSRCLGIYTSFIVGIIVSLYEISFLSRIRFYDIFIFFIFLTVPLLIDGFTQLYKMRESNNILRLITGMMFGFGVSFTFTYLFFTIPFLRVFI